MFAIRKARALDNHQLEELFLTIRLHTFTWEPPSRFKKEDFEKSTEGEEIFVAEESKKIIGFISAWTHDSPCFIHHLFVSPLHQGKGIGKALIKSLFSWLPFPFRLKCLKKNEKALKFYLKNHWIQIEEGMSKDGEYVLLELRDSKGY